MSNPATPSANIVVVDGVARVARTNLAVWLILGLIKRGALPSFFTGHPVCLDHLTTDEMFDAWVYYMAHEEDINFQRRADERMGVDSLIRNASVHLPGRRILHDDSAAMARFHGTKDLVWQIGYLLRHGLTFMDLLSSYPDLSAMDLHNAQKWCAQHKDQVDQQIEEDEACDDEDRRTVRILRQHSDTVRATRLPRPL